MLIRLAARGSICALASLSSGLAVAQTATTQFGVQITIVSECQINAADDMDFGEVGVIDAPIPATSTIAVQCTNGTPFSLGLDAGTGAGATVATRLMTGPNSEEVEYTLYSDPAHNLIWGDTIGDDTVEETGTGSEETFPVYGLVPPQSTPSAGTYTDVVTVTASY